MWDVVCEGRWAPMILLAMVLAVAVAWRRSRPSKAATMLAVIAALALLLLPILNWLVVTDREAVTASLLSMEKAANSHDIPSILAGIDTDFRSHGGLDRAGLNNLLKSLDQRYGVKSINVRRPEVLPAEPDGSRPCEFTLKLTGESGEYVVMVKTIWKKRDGVWRILKVTVTKFLDKDQTPLPV